MLKFLEVSCTASSNFCSKKLYFWFYGKLFEFRQLSYLLIIFFEFSLIAVDCVSGSVFCKVNIISDNILSFVKFFFPIC